MEEWRDTVVAGSEVAHMAAAGSRSSEAKGDLLLSEVRIRRKDSEEDQRSFVQARAPPQIRRAVIRVESRRRHKIMSQHLL